MKYYNEDDISRALNSAISATETMNDLVIDYDIIKARLKVIREISDGLGIDIKIPSNRKMMIKNFVGGAQ